MDFDSFYAATSRAVVGQVYALTGDLGAAEDAAAEAYARAWQRWGTVSALDSPEAWVRRVAMRFAVSSWRKTRNRLLAHHRAVGPLATASPGPDRVVFVEVLRAIPVKQRQAMVLRYIADLSVAEIAVEMGVAEGTVKSWLSRGRDKLSAQLLDTPAQTSGRGSGRTSGRTSGRGGA